jgi:hypothetical protein
VPFSRAENPANNNAVNVGISKNLEFRRHQSSDRLIRLLLGISYKAAIIWVSTTPELKITHQSLQEEEAWGCGQMIEER